MKPKAIFRGDTIEDAGVQLPAGKVWIVREILLHNRSSTTTHQVDVHQPGQAGTTAASTVIFKVEIEPFKTVVLKAHLVVELERWIKFTRPDGAGNVFGIVSAVEGDA